jgi:hypothetical protein
MLEFPGKTGGDSFQAYVNLSERVVSTLIDLSAMPNLTRRLPAQLQRSGSHRHFDRLMARRCPGCSLIARKRAAVHKGSLTAAVTSISTRKPAQLIQNRRILQISQKDQNFQQSRVVAADLNERCVNLLQYLRDLSLCIRRRIFGDFYPPCDAAVNDNVGPTR